jgi:hypothetical protein
MVSSILMLLSSYGDKTIVKNACAVIWIFHLLYCSNFRPDFFTIISLVTFSSVVLLIQKIGNERLKTGSAIASILLYSICIDTYCYYAHPLFALNRSLLHYIWNGISFNLRYALLNGLIVLFAELGKRSRTRPFHNFLITVRNRFSCSYLGW